MKLLIDMNLSPSWIDVFHQQGWEAFFLLTFRVNLIYFNKSFGIEYIDEIGGKDESL